MIVLIVVIGLILQFALPVSLVQWSANMSNFGALIFPFVLMYLNSKLPSGPAPALGERGPGAQLPVLRVLLRQLRVRPTHRGGPGPVLSDSSRYGRVAPKRFWRWTIEVDDPVQGRREQVVGPAGQHVADVDHEGARHRVGVHPAAGGVAPPGAAPVVLGEQSQAAVGSPRWRLVIARRSHLAWIEWPASSASAYLDHGSALTASHRGRPAPAPTRLGPAAWPARPAAGAVRRRW